jgi:hypothetical protein
LPKPKKNKTTYLVSAAVGIVHEVKTKNTEQPNDPAELDSLLSIENGGHEIARYHSNQKSNADEGKNIHKKYEHSGSWLRLKNSRAGFSKFLSYKNGRPVYSKLLPNCA